MNVWKPLAVAFAAAFALSVGVHAASANPNPTPAPIVGAGPCMGQPHMGSALGLLQQALTQLNQAEHNKHNWRVNAVGSVNAAIEQTTAGCNAAN